MSFLNPLFLAALAAVAIPLAIHFWRVRKPEVLPFSSLIFFRKLKQKAIKRLRLKEYLLLALRIAAIIMLALALARPFLPPTLLSSDSTTNRKFVLVIDNSPSMQRVDANGPYIDQAKKTAEKIMRQAQPNDQFVILTSQGIDQPYSVTQWLAPEQGINRLDNIDVRASAFDLPKQWQQLKQQVEKRNGQGVSLNWYIIGDTQQAAINDLEGLLNQVESNGSWQHMIQYIRLGEAESVNLAVQSMDIDSNILAIDKPFTLSVDVANTGQRDALNQYVTLRHNGEVVGQYEADIAHGSTRTFSFELNANEGGQQLLEVDLEGDDVTYDNHYRAALSIPKRRNVLYVSESNDNSSSSESFFLALIKASQQANTVLDWTIATIAETDANTWMNYDAIVLDGLAEIPAYVRSAAAEFVQQGGGLIIIPAPKSNIRSYNIAFDQLRIGQLKDVNGALGSQKTITTIRDISDQHPIIRQIFDTRDKDNPALRINSIPVNYYYRLQAVNQAPGQRIVMAAETGDPILVDSPLGQGRVLVSTIGLSNSWSSFPLTPLFAPLWYQSSLYAAAGSTPKLQAMDIQSVFEWTGPVDFEETSLHINDVTYQPELRAVSGGNETRVEMVQQGWEPGWITLHSVDTTFSIGLNLPFIESDLTEKSLNELDKSRFNSLTIRNEINVATLSNQDLEAELKTATFGQEIWQWFIALAVILLIIESIVTAWYKPVHESST